MVFVEPNYLLAHSATANDSYYIAANLSGMYGNDSPVCGPTNTTNQTGPDAEEAWNLGYNSSADVYVGIIVEGVQVTHPDLSPNISNNPCDPVDGVDNDRNGYVDDTNGWDFFNRDNSVCDPSNGDAHGTHVAGTIGARGGNGFGVAGMVWNVRMISAKFLGPAGGYISDAINALNYLRDLKRRHGLRIIAANNSWGAGAYSSALHTAILRAAKADILFVAAAGNNGANNDSAPYFPANYPTLRGTSIEAAASSEAVLSVAVISSRGARALFSNFGATAVDIGAPGVGVWSTIPSDSYAAYDGTSMAPSHVSGAIELYVAAFPSATAAEIRSAVLSASKPTTALAGFSVTGGRLSLEGILRPPPIRTPTPTRTATATATRAITQTPTPTRTATTTPTQAIAQTPLISHDLGVISVFAPNPITAGQRVMVSVTVVNEGTQTANASISVSASGGTVEGGQTVSLAPGAS